MVETILGRFQGEILEPAGTGRVSPRVETLLIDHGCCWRHFHLLTNLKFQIIVNWWVLLLLLPLGRRSFTCAASFECGTTTSDRREYYGREHRVRSGCGAGDVTPPRVGIAAALLKISRWNSADAACCWPGRCRKIIL